MREVRKGAAFVLVALTTVLSGCHPLDNALTAIFGRSMRDQPYIHPYEDPRSSPEGTVPFAAANYPDAPDRVNVGQPAGPADLPPPMTQADVAAQTPVVTELENPVPPSEESLERGQQLFERSCAPCHGDEGAGDGTVTQAGYPAFPIATPRAAGFPDGVIYGIIRVGRGLMPAYGHQLSHFDRWHVVNYLRQLQGALPDQGDDAGASSEGQG